MPGAPDVALHNTPGPPEFHRVHLPSHDLYRRPNYPTVMTVDDEEILDVVHDEYARAILRQVSAEALSGPELIERLDASKPTVYRRLSTLEDLDLVAARIRPHDDGGQRKVYVADLEAVHVHFGADGVSVTVDRATNDPVDRFTALVGDLT